MAYIRKIFYLYSYHGQKKGENVGFVRVQGQDEWLKLMIYLKIPASFAEETLTVCMVGSGLITRIGSMRPVNHNYSYRSMLADRNIAGSNHPFSEYEGILVFGEETDALLYGVSFMDGELSSELLSLRLGNDNNQEPTKAKEPENQELHTAESVDPEPAETVSAESDGKRDAVSFSENESENDEIENNKSENKSELWNRMTRDIGKMRILERADCVALRPFQMSRLPRKYWHLSGNNFLLHGYYVYGHLILARTQDEDGEVKFWLGVPGNGEGKEENAARSYGFGHYIRRILRKQSGMPEGYWCMELDLSE